MDSDTRKLGFETLNNNTTSRSLCSEKKQV